MTAGTGQGRRLTEISRALTYARSLEEVLDLTVDCAIELLGASRALLMLSEDDDLLHVRASRGIDPQRVERFREPLDENLLYRLTELVGPEASERFLGVPLVVHGDVIGLLGVRLEGAGEPAIDDERETLLSALADQASVALYSTRHEQVRDSLEGRVRAMERERQRTEKAFEILGHDLRSPLHAIQGYVQLLVRGIHGPLNDAQRETLERVMKVHRHIDAILGNVLEMARLDHGRLPIEPRRVRIEDVVDDALEIVRPAAQSADITLETTGAPLPEVLTDADRLRQVLVQLLDNAVKYAPDGSRVVVQLRSIDVDERRGIDVAITDEGPGVPADRQQAVFEPWVRQDGKSERGRAGVGLGLAISMGIVQRLGGTLTLESRPGEGATFRVRLPLRHPAASGGDAGMDEPED